MKRIAVLLFCIVAFVIGTDSLVAQTPLKAPPGMSYEPNDVWKKVNPTKPADLWPPPPPGLDLSTYQQMADKKMGAITASDQGLPKEGPENAFDRRKTSDKAKKFCVKAKSMWLQYQYGDNAKQKVIAYVITVTGDTPARAPKSWKMLGSNDGQTWETLDEQIDQNFDENNLSRLFKIAKPGSYNSYRLDVSENHGDECIQLSQLNLLGEKSAAAPKPGKGNKKQERKK